MYDPVHTFLAKVASNPINIDLTGLNIRDPESFGEGAALDYNQWGGRINTPEFRGFQAQHPARAANVLAADRFGAQAAANPGAPLDFSGATFVNQPNWWDAAKDVAGGAFSGLRRGVGGALSGGTAAYSRYAGLRDPKSPQFQQLQGRIADSFKRNISPYSEGYRRHAATGMTNFLSRKFNDWTGNWGGFGKSLNPILQFLLGLISKVPGYGHAASWLGNRFGGNPMQGGQPKTAAWALPSSSPYAHYRRVATMPCGAEILERWNRS